MPAAELVLTRANPTLFTATLDGVAVCRAAVAVADGVWEIYSTATTPGYEGRGIAAALVRFTLDAAEEAGVSVIPSCWYVDGFMGRHADRYDHLRVGHEAPAAEMGDACRIAPVVLPGVEPGSTHE
ncbi:MAG: GNAT family N-acetyltransferase [Candidatus Nanopelagicales bacterium]